MKKLFLIIAIFISVNANAQWERVSNGLDTTKYIDALASDGINIFAGADSKGVYISTNNGELWTQTSLNNKSISSFAMLGNNIFAGTFYNGIYLSTNNGTNWSQTFLDNQSIYSLVICGNNIFAGGDSGVYISTNNGINWTRTNLNFHYVHVLSVNGTNIFAQTSYSGVFLTTNNGMNWTHPSPNNFPIFYSFAFLGNTIFGGTGICIYISTNIGASWIPGNLWTEIPTVASKGSKLFAGTQYGVYRTIDTGLSYFQINEGFNVIPNVQKLLITDNYIFASGYNNNYTYIWRQPIAELVDVQSISTETPLKYSLSQNYPNPFNPSTNIKFNVPGLSSPYGLSGELVQLKVYYITGREVQTLVNERFQPGTYEANFNAGNLPSGIYFYTLFANDTKINTKKMIVLK